jgi:hypothetical protein
MAEFTIYQHEHGGYRVCVTHLKRYEMIGNDVLDNVVRDTALYGSYKGYMRIVDTDAEQIEMRFYNGRWVFDIGDRYENYTELIMVEGEPFAE